MSKKILLIGGAGFIGSHLTKGLLEKGYNIVIVDKEKGIDANNKEQLSKVFKKEKPDIVYHLAGAINLRKGESDSGLERAELVCQLCKENKIKKLIFFSSGGAICFDPESQYAKANVEIEKIIQKELSFFIILRLGNVYGPGQWEQGIIPQVILNKNLVIKSDGNQTRNFVYVDDVVELAILAMETDKKGIYNVDAGQEHSINQVIDLIRKLTGLVISPAYNGSRDISAKAFDIEKTKKDFNWEPKISLERGLTETIKSFNL
jgi:UDP-glucose 4-epimerase